MSPVIDPSFLTSGAEWRIGGAQDAAGAETPSGFGNILGDQICCRDDPAHRVGVVHEVLPQPLGRPQPEPISKVAELRCPQ